MVVDGSGRDPVVADVLIDGPVIRKVARRVDDTGVEPVEGRGLCLAPGFIDLHSHSDLCSTLRNGRGAPIGLHRAGR